MDQKEKKELLYDLWTYARSLHGIVNHLDSIYWELIVMEKLKAMDGKYLMMKEHPREYGDLSQ